METRRINIILTTYNRPEMCEKLLRQLHEQDDSHNLRMNVFVIEDAGAEHSGLFAPPAWHTTHFDYFNNIWHRKCMEHHGKEGYWELVNLAIFFSKQDSPDSDLLLFMPDDITIQPNFITELLRLWDSIQDENKMALSYLMMEKWKVKGNWTYQTPEPHGEVWKTGWVDMAFIAPMKKFIELIYPLWPIDPHRWDNNPGLSSGVGQQISTRLLDTGCTMYHTDKSLCFHGDHESQMHPEHRKGTPLITDTNS